MLSIRRLIGLSSVLFVVSACGGGGSSGGNSGAQTPPPSTPTYTVATSVTGSGSGTISPSSRTITQGDTAGFTLAPALGSMISSVSGCGGTLMGTTYTTGTIQSNCNVVVSFEPLPDISQLFQGLNIPGARSLILSDSPLTSGMAAGQPEMVAMSLGGTAQVTDELGYQMMVMSLGSTAQVTTDEDERGDWWYKVIEGGEVLDLLFIDQDGNPYPRHISNEYIAKCEGNADRCVSIEALLEIDQRYLLVAGALYFDPYAQGKYYMFLVDRDSGTTYSLALDEAAAAGGFGQYVFNVGLAGGAHPKVLPNGDIVGDASGRHFILQTSDLGSGPLRYSEFPAITGGSNGLDYVNAFEVSDEYFLIYQGTVISTGRPACRVIDLLDGNRLIDVPSLLPIASQACYFKRTDKGRIVVSTSNWASPTLGLMAITRDATGQLIGLEADQADCLSTSSVTSEFFPGCQLRNPPKSTIGGLHGLVVASDGYVARGTWVAGRYFFGIGLEQIEELDSDAGTVTAHMALNEALCNNYPCNSVWVSSFASSNFVWMFGLNENEQYVVARLDPISRQVDRYSFDPDLEVYGLSVYSEDTLMFRADRISDLARLVGTVRITNQELTYEVFASMPPEDLYVYPLTPTDLVHVDGNPADWNSAQRVLFSGSDSGLEGEHLLAYSERFATVLGKSHYFGLVEFNSPIELQNHTRIHVHPYILTLGPAVRELRLPAAYHDGSGDEVVDLKTQGGLRLATASVVEFSLPETLFLQRPATHLVERVALTGVIKEVLGSIETIDNGEYVVLKVEHASPMGDSTALLQVTEGVQIAFSITAAVLIQSDGTERRIEEDLGGQVLRSPGDAAGNTTELRIPRQATGPGTLDVTVISIPTVLILDTLQ